MVSCGCILTGIHYAAIRALIRLSPRSHPNSVANSLAKGVLLGAAPRYCSWMSSESHLGSDEIHIEQLEVSSVIGVSEHERKAPQRLTINISFWPRRQTR